MWRQFRFGLLERWLRGNGYHLMPTVEHAVIDDQGETVDEVGRDGEVPVPVVDDQENLCR